MMRNEMDKLMDQTGSSLPFAEGNTGFPEFSESPDFVALSGSAQGAKHVDEQAWMDSKLLSPEVRQMLQSAMKCAKA